jgi:hypothetical protein
MWPSCSHRICENSGSPSRSATPPTATLEPTAFDWLCLDPLDRVGQRNRAAKGLPGSDIARVMEVMRSTARVTRNLNTAEVPTLGWTTVQRMITVGPDRG